MNFVDEIDPATIVVGELTKEECTAMLALHGGRHLKFCTCEEETDGVLLEMHYDMIKEVWVVPSRKRMPPYLEEILNAAEKRGLPVIAPPTPSLSGDQAA